MTGRHAEKPSALRSGNIDLSYMHIDVPPGGLVHYQPTFSLALTTLSLHRVCVKRICRKLGGSIRAVTLRLEVRMDKFPPLSQHKSLVVTKLGVFHSSSQNFFTPGQVGATIALLVRTRHWPCSDFVRILTVSQLA